MRKLFLIAVVGAAIPVAAQNVDFSSLDGLRARADNVVTVNLGPELLAFANAFLSPEDREEAAALRVTEGLESIQVRVFEFSQAGAYSPEDLAAVRQQFQADGWVRVVEIDQDDSDVGIWMFMDPAPDATGEVGGMAMLVEEESEVVLVNIVGSISPEDIAALGAEFANLEDLGDLGDLSNLGNLVNGGAGDDDQD